MGHTLTGYKQCSMCGRFQPLSDYHKKGNRTSSRCKHCTAVVDRKRRNKNTSLRSKYKISKEDYESLLEKQNGCCAICSGTKIASNRSYLYVDHDHDTGEVRGLLCHRCNIAIGYVEDQSFVEKALKYLRDYNGNS